jgi:peptide/nickel transport system permease protein
MRTMDVLLAFPPILFLLVVATGAGASIWALVFAIAIIHVPSIARILRAAALEVSVRGYVEAAIARGDRTDIILRREILPNIWGTIVADGGPRFTVSILLVAAVNFLGLGLTPPTADWALMISENRYGITVNPWSVVAPALMIGALTVSINVVADAIAGRLGKSVETEALRR